MLGTAALAETIKKGAGWRENLFVARLRPSGLHVWTSPLPGRGAGCFPEPRPHVWASLESVEAIGQKCSFAEPGADVRFLSPKIFRAPMSAYAVLPRFSGRFQKIRLTAFRSRCAVFPSFEPLDSSTKFP